MKAFVRSPVVNCPSPIHDGLKVFICMDPFCMLGKLFCSFDARKHAQVLCKLAKVYWRSLKKLLADDYFLYAVILCATST